MTKEERRANRIKKGIRHPAIRPKKKAVTTHAHKVHLARTMLRRHERSARGVSVFDSENWAKRHARRENPKPRGYKAPKK